MTVVATQRVPWRGWFIQALMVLLMNVPTISFGLAMGWVSLASGESGSGGAAGPSSEEEDARMVVAASTTFAAGLLGVPLSARLLVAGRKLTVIATSAAFVVCWALKLAGGGWWVVAARVAAGLAGAGAWCVAPLLAREMCSSGVRGAAVSALVLAHNLGFLLMYLAADSGLSHRTILWACLVLSAAHCVLFLFVPESPAYLAANGKPEEARAALAWLRGVHREDPALSAELLALPPPDDDQHSPFKLFKELVSSPQRVRALWVSGLAVVGQEACGVLALLQFAERVFVVARDQHGAGAGADDEAAEGRSAALVTPARHAVVLGAAQLVASAVALYLVERIGRRPLLVSMAWVTSAFLALGAALVALGGAWARWAGAALAAAVAADSAGLQPVPYALLADMFHYKYRGCALALASVAGAAGNAAEVAVFPLVALRGGLPAALALSAALTAAYAAFASAAVPETRGLSPDDIYRALGPAVTASDRPTAVVTLTKEPCSDETRCTPM